jgi:guanine nucleotide-binding protein subunit alpha
MYRCVHRTNSGEIRSKEIDLAIAKEVSHKRRQFKVLLLGSGECGKSTLLKQAKILYCKGFSESESMAFELIIKENLNTIIHSLHDAILKLDIKLEAPWLENELSSFITQKTDFKVMKSAQTTSVNMLRFFDQLVKNAGVQSLFKISSQLNLPEGTEFFLNNFQRLATTGFKPTEEDILFARSATTGVIQTTFEYNGSEMVYIDVGGQRSERKKWINQFDNVKMILFVASLIDYDRTMYEDKTSNRVADSLMLFESICNSRWFVKSGIILFLNKHDLFQKKIKLVPLQNTYPEYDGQDDLAKAKKFFKKLYLSKVKESSRHIYHHFTCATDTNMCKTVLADINNMIVKGNLANMGLI